MMINFMCQLKWATGYPDSWLNIISLCVLETNELCQWTCVLVKWSARWFSQCYTPSNLLKTWTEQRRSVLAVCGIHSVFRVPGCQAFRHRLKSSSSALNSQAFWLHSQDPWVSNLQMVIIGLSWFHNCRKQYLVIILLRERDERGKGRRNVELVLLLRET